MAVGELPRAFPGWHNDLWAYDTHPTAFHCPLEVHWERALAALGYALEKAMGSAAKWPSSGRGQPYFEKHVSSAAGPERFDRCFLASPSQQMIRRYVSNGYCWEGMESKAYAPPPAGLQYAEGIVVAPGQTIVEGSSWTLNGCGCVHPRLVVWKPLSD